MTEINEILNERGSRYGSFSGNGRVAQAIKAAMRDSPNWETLSDDKKECFEMLASKVSRILNGDPDYKHNYIDCIGFLQLVIENIEGNEPSRLMSIVEQIKRQRE